MITFNFTITRQANMLISQQKYHFRYLWHVKCWDGSQLFQLLCWWLLQWV